jgi:hypothetical protein
MTGGAFVFCYEARLTHVSHAVRYRGPLAARDLLFPACCAHVRSSMRGM